MRATLTLCVVAPRCIVVALGTLLPSACSMTHTYHLSGFDAAPTPVPGLEGKRVAVVFVEPGMRKEYKSKADGQPRRQHRPRGKTPVSRRAGRATCAFVGNAYLHATRLVLLANGARPRTNACARGRAVQSAHAPERLSIETSVPSRREAPVQ